MGDQPLVWRGNMESENQEKFAWENKVSEFKLYLIKNKDKFKVSLNEILELI